MMDTFSAVFTDVHSAGKDVFARICVLPRVGDLVFIEGKVAAISGKVESVSVDFGKVEKGHILGIMPQMVTIKVDTKVEFVD